MELQFTKLITYDFIRERERKKLNKASIKHGSI